MGSGVRIPLAEVAAIARDRWQPAMIEEALGAGAAAILPAPLRTRTITVHLARYQVAVLHHFAQKEGVMVDAILARRLDGLMSEHSEDLAGVIEDFGVALNWPEPHDAKRAPKTDPRMKRKEGSTVLTPKTRASIRAIFDHNGEPFPSMKRRPSWVGTSPRWML